MTKETLYFYLVDELTGEPVQERTKRRIEEARLQDEREKEEARGREKEEARERDEADAEQQKLTLKGIEDKVNELNDKKCCTIA